MPLGGYVRVTGMHKEEFEARVAEAREEERRHSGDLDGDEEWEDRRRPQDPEDRLAGKRALSADEIAATPLERRYYSHPFWHKLLFIIAGVAMNMIVAFLLIFIVGLTQGESVTSTVISEVGGGHAGGRGRRAARRPRSSASAARPPTRGKRCVRRSFSIPVRR